MLFFSKKILFLLIYIEKQKDMIKKKGKKNFCWYYGYFLIHTNIMLGFFVLLLLFSSMTSMLSMDDKT